jgi:3-deoxy-D-manno-octulosonic-acid transferase
MIIWLYNLGMVCYAGLIRLAAMWNPKAKAMLLGWRETKTLNRTQIHHQINGVVSPSFELIWIHCASLGEFEMAKPIAAALQAASSQRHVLFSFFSPSGYNHAVLDINQTKVYLPLDGASSAKRWMQQWNPQAAIFIRYEFWYHYMKSLHQNQIPAFALGVAIAPNHFLLSRIAQPWRKQPISQRLRFW